MLKAPLIPILIALFGFCCTSARRIVRDDGNSTQPKCPSGWLFNSASNNCYFMSAVPLRWVDAQISCQNMGSNLASINDSNEYNFLIKLAYQSNPLYLTWLGLKAPDNQSPFQWIDRNPLNFVKWLPDQPTSYGGLCAAWRTYNSDGSDGWKNIACESQQQYICKQIGSYCPNGTQMGTSGQVASQNYPGDYPNNLNCVYKITVPVGSRVNLTFDYFDLELKYDAVTIFDGPDTLSPIIANLTGHWPKEYNESQVSTNNMMTILFVTDRSVVYHGWHANWIAIALNESFCPNGSLGGFTGMVASPHYPNEYDNNLDCIYQITASSNLARVKLTFDAFNTESCCDKLTLFDGPSIRSRQIVTLSGEPSNSGAVGTSYNTTSYVMTMLFHTDRSVVRSGWHATYITFA